MWNAYAAQYRERKAVELVQRYRDNAEERCAYKRAWRKANFNRDNEQRRVRELGAEGDHTPQEWRELCSRYGNRCLICQGSKRITKDHMVPLSRGGTHYITNLAPVCYYCNLHKGAEFYCSRPDRMIAAYAPP